jgi:tetratricopeptide (TPR) repeat protein
MDPDTLRTKGDRLRDARAWAPAAAAYAAHLALRPDAHGIRVQLGHCLKEAGDVEAALAHYRAAEAASPADADLAVQIGHALKLLGRAEDAAAAYAEALLRDPARADAAAEIAALMDRLPVPEAALLVLGALDLRLVAALPAAQFACWDADAAGFRWLPAGLALHRAATGAPLPDAATRRPRLAPGAVVLLAGPLPAEALAGLAPLADAHGARIALLAAPGWAGRGLSVARLLAAAEGAGDPAALADAARRAAPPPGLPPPRLGHAVTLGTGPVAQAAPEHGLGLLAPRSGAWGEVLPDGRRLGVGSAWLRVARPDPAPLRLLVLVAAAVPCRVSAGCGGAEAVGRLDRGERLLLSLAVPAGNSPLDLRLTADRDGAVVRAFGVAREAVPEERLALHEALLFRHLT